MLIIKDSYDEWGNLSKREFSLSGSSSHYTYTPDGMLLKSWTIHDKTGPRNDGKRIYEYDDAKMPKIAGEWSLVHNPLGQLIQANSKPIHSGEKPYDSMHGYDGYGNQIYHFTGTKQFEFSPLPENRLPSTTSGDLASDWAYNANGEALGFSTGGPLIGSALDKEYFKGAWDGLGRLSAGSWGTQRNPVAKQTYAYYADGLRALLNDEIDPKKNATYFYATDGKLYSAHDSKYGLRRIIYMGNQPVAELFVGGRFADMHIDPLGTPRMIFADNGQVVCRQSFGPYGEPLYNSENTYTPLTGYTGHLQADATGLIYMKGRYYSPTWHRFINSDQGVDPNSPNQYAYCGGSPFMNTDPNGMFLSRVGNWFKNFFRVTCSSSRVSSQTQNIFGHEVPVAEATVEVVDDLPKKAKGPDFVALDLSFKQIPNITFSVTLDRYGRVYVGGTGGFGASLTGFNGDVRFGNAPNSGSEDLRGFLSGKSSGAMIAPVLGYSTSWNSIRSSSEFVVGSPQVSIGVGYTFSFEWMSIPGVSW